MLITGLVLLLVSVLLIIYRKKVFAKLPKSYALVVLTIATVILGYYVVSFFINPVGY